MEKKQAKIRGLGLQIQQPREDDDENLIDNFDADDFKEKKKKKSFRLQCSDKDQEELVEQIERLSIQNKSKTQEIKDELEKIISIVPKNENQFQLKDFQPIQRLGKGGSGKVDKVIHTPTENVYALKKIGLINDDNFMKYLNAEIKALIGSESLYIVKYSGAFFEEGFVNILLEFMDYGSLGHLLEKIKKIPDVILGIIIYQILQGLHYLHYEMKIIHRDIKPLNILLNSEGLVKITDFGVCGGTTNSVQQLNSWVGTTLYMSPERLKQDLYSFDTDVWSLGMTILECILGYHPLSQYQQQDKSFWSLLEQVQHFKIPEFPPNTPAQLKDFVVKCLSIDPAQRPSVKDLLNHDLVRKYSKLEDGGKDKFVQWLKVLKLNQDQK